MKKGYANASLTQACLAIEGIFGQGQRTDVIGQVLSPGPGPVSEAVTEKHWPYLYQVPG